MSKFVLHRIHTQMPGYLRLIRAAPEMGGKWQAIAETMKGGKFPSPAQVDEIVDMLLLFVAEPADKQEARNAILDASAEELAELMTAVANLWSQHVQG